MSKTPVLFTLEENRKVSVKIFKNRVYVCVREFYQIPESTEWHAGLKGLNLNVLERDRLKLLASNMNYIISSSKDLCLSHEMSRFSLQPDYSVDYQFTGYCRKVKMMSFCVFKGTPYVSLRVYVQYVSGGQLYPTGRGIHLTQSQWEKLQILFQPIDNALKKLYDEVQTS